MLLTSFLFFFLCIPPTPPQSPLPQIHPEPPPISPEKNSPTPFQVVDKMEKTSVSLSELTKDSSTAPTESSSLFQSNLSQEDFVFIILDCYSYTAGEKITGEILLNITEPLPGGSLKFQAAGLEEISVFDPKERLKLVAEEKSEVFTIDCPLQDWETQIDAGQYVFPFTLKIPSHSPSTLYFSSQDQRGFYVKAEIRYTIVVLLTSANSLFSLSHSRDLLIKNKAALGKSAATAESVENIHGCCTSRGATRLKLAVINTEHCEVDSEVRFKLEPDNSMCRVPINQVVSRVKMEFTANTKRGEFKIIQSLANIDRAAWIGALSSRIYEKDFEYTARLKLGEIGNASSNNTPLIRCSYYVEVLIYYDMYFRKEPISIVLPFHVNPNNCIPKQMPKLPNNWDPIESSIFAFTAEGRNSMFSSYDHMPSISSEITSK